MRSVGFRYAIRLAVVSLALGLLGLLPKLLRREVPTQLTLGQTLIFPLLVSKDFDYVTLVVNGAVKRPLHGSDRHTTGTLGAGVKVLIRPGKASPQQMVRDGN